MFITNKIGPRANGFRGHTASDITISELFGRDNILFSSGRDAIYYALKLILEKKGSIRILLPSYLCSSIFESILPLKKVSIYFYKLNKNLQIDTTDLLKKIKRHQIDVLYIIHYFGFIDLQFKEILKFCKIHQIIVIEDCAVSLFTKLDGEYLGSFGDFGIFSLGKYFSLPDGGALKINSGFTKSTKIKVGRLNRSSFFRGLIKQFLLYLIEKFNFPYAFYGNNQLYFKLKFLIQKIKSLSARKSNNLFSYQPFYISKFSKYILSKADIGQLIKIRRANFEVFLSIFKNFSNISFLYDYLPEQTCPFLFPFLVKNRDEIRGKFLDLRIEPAILWRSDKLWEKFIDKEEFSNSYWVSKQILCLPIHQNIRERELNYIIKVVTEILK